MSELGQISTPGQEKGIPAAKKERKKKGEIRKGDTSGPRTAMKVIRQERKSVRVDAVCLMDG